MLFFPIPKAVSDRKLCRFEVRSPKGWKYSTLFKTVEIIFPTAKSTAGIKFFKNFQNKNFRLDAAKWLLKNTLQTGYHDKGPFLISLKSSTWVPSLMLVSKNTRFFTYYLDLQSWRGAINKTHNGTIQLTILKSINKTHNGTIQLTFKKLLLFI